MKTCGDDHSKDITIALNGGICLLWGVMDDFKTHLPTKAKKCGEGFSAFMDLMVQLGFIRK
jgi:hypothetical protein